MINLEKSSVNITNSFIDSTDIKELTNYWKSHTKDLQEFALQILTDSGLQWVRTRYNCPILVKSVFIALYPTSDTVPLSIIPGVSYQNVQNRLLGRLYKNFNNELFDKEVSTKSNQNENFLKLIVLSEMSVRDKIKTLSFIQKKESETFQRMLEQNFVGQNILDLIIERLGIFDALELLHFFYAINPTFRASEKHLLDCLEDFLSIDEPTESSLDPHLLKMARTLSDVYPKPRSIEISLLMHEIEWDLWNEKFEECMNKIKNMQEVESVDPDTLKFYISRWFFKYEANIFSLKEVNQLSAKSLSPIIQRCFLPLLPPSDIQAVTAAIPDEERFKLLQECQTELQNWDEESQPNYDVFAVAAAVAAQDDHLQNLILDCLRRMSPDQISVVIPQISKEKLLTILENASEEDKNFNFYIFCATPEQLKYCFEANGCALAHSKVILRRPLAFEFLTKHGLIHPFQENSTGLTLFKSFMDQASLPDLNSSNALPFGEIEDGDILKTPQDFSDKEDFIRYCKHRIEIKEKKREEYSHFFAQMLFVSKNLLGGLSLNSYRYEKKYSPNLAGNLYDLAHSLNLRARNVQLDISNPKALLHIGAHTESLLYSKLSCLVEAFLFENHEIQISEVQKINIVRRMLETGSGLLMTSRSRIDAFQKESILTVKSGFEGHSFPMVFFKFGGRSFRVIPTQNDKEGLRIHYFNDKKFDINILAHIEESRGISKTKALSYLHNRMLVALDASDDHPVCALFKEIFNRKPQSMLAGNCVFIGCLADFELQYAFEALQGKEQDLRVTLNEVKKQSEWCRHFISLKLMIDVYKEVLKRTSPFDLDFEMWARKKICKNQQKLAQRFGPPPAFLLPYFESFGVLAKQFEKQFGSSQQKELNDSDGRPMKRAKTSKYNQSECIIS